MTRRPGMRVVKVGGRVQQDARLAGTISRAWRDSGGRLCLVHGGGDEISRLQRALGLQPQFVGGRRVTTDQDLELVRMCLSGSANKRIVSDLLDAGVPAWGISGEDGGLLVARTDAALPLGKVGVPDRVDVTLIRAILDSGRMPVISPVARDGAGGGALNVNGDDAAAAIAGALDADELLFVADVDGVLEESGAVVGQLDRAGADALVSSGVVNRGMAAKLDAGFSALSRGARRVRIGQLSAVLDAEAGTLLTTSAEVLI